MDKKENELKPDMMRCPWDGKLYKSPDEFPPMPKDNKPSEFTTKKLTDKPVADKPAGDKS